MIFPFPAKRAKTLVDTTVIEILKAAADPSIISFAGGVPSPKTFPLLKFKQAAVSAINKYGEAGLQYRPTQGAPQFLETLAKFLSKKWQKKINSENILITSGSQQALDLTGKTFINPGEILVSERPSYFVALQAFSAYAPIFKEISLENNELDLTKLERFLRQKAKIVYLNPNFQNPSAQTLSLAQRKEIVRLAEKYPKTLFFEDAAYTDLYFDKKYPDLISMSANIVHLGTFSKTLAPGLRLGYVVGPKDIIKNLTLVKQSADLHTNSLSQLIVNEILLDKNWFIKHLEKNRKFYKKQSKLMESCLNKYLKNAASWNSPQGGLFYWLKLNTNTKKVYQRALKQKVAFVPGHVFFAKKPSYFYLRLSFATASQREMEKGIKKLANLLKLLKTPKKAYSKASQKKTAKKTLDNI